MKHYRKRTAMGMRLSVAVVCAISNSLCAQQPGSTHTVSVGTSVRRINDEYLKVNAHQLHTTDLSYSIASFTPRRIKNVRLNWEAGHNDGLRMQMFGLHYSDLFSVLSIPGSRLQLYVGYGLSTNPSYLRSSTSAGNAHSWAVTNSVSVENYTSYTAGRNLLSLNLSLHIAGFTSRPSRETGMGENLNGLLYSSYQDLFFTSVHNQPAGSLRLNYIRYMSRKMSVGISYNMNYNELQERKTYKEIGGGLEAEVSWRL